MFLWQLHFRVLINTEVDDNLVLCVLFLTWINEAFSYYHWQDERNITCNYKVTCKAFRDRLKWCFIKRMSVRILIMVILLQACNWLEQYFIKRQDGRIAKWVGGFKNKYCDWPPHFVRTLGLGAQTASWHIPNRSDMKRPKSGS